MPAGLQVWNSGGQLIADVSDRFGRVIGVTDTGSSNGSVNVSGLSLGEPWVAVQPYTSNVFHTPTVNVSGTLITWTFPESTKGPCLLIYGVF